MSGQVALLLDEKSSLTPDEVKGLLMSTARPLAADGSVVQGAGVVDVTAALDHLEAKRVLPVAASATLPRSTGLGSLEASRGGEHVLDPSTGVVLTGEVDALGAPWSPAAWVTAQKSKGGVWVDGTYNGRTWAGSKWSHKELLPAVWSGSSWSGAAWDQHAWSDDQWEARMWRGNSWRARMWRADSWVARMWRSDSWTTRP